MKEECFGNLAKKAVEISKYDINVMREPKQLTIEIDRFFENRIDQKICIICFVYNSKAQKDKMKKYRSFTSGILDIKTSSVREANKLLELITEDFNKVYQCKNIEDLEKLLKGE